MALFGLCAGMVFVLSVCPSLSLCVCLHVYVHCTGDRTWLACPFLPLFSPSWNCQAGLFPSTCGNLSAMRSCGWGWIVLEHVILTQALSTKVQQANVGGLLQSQTRGHFEASCFFIQNQFRFFRCPCPSRLPHSGAGNKLIS